MDIKLPNSEIKGGSASTPKARVLAGRKPARLRGFSPFSLVRYGTRHWTGQPGPILREPGAIVPALAPGPRAEIGPFPPLGIPLNIAEVARLIGCSPWTVRQTLIPRGLPHFRFKANGRLVFYRDQIVRWIENQQQGG